MKRGTRAESLKSSCGSKNQLKRERGWRKPAARASSRLAANQPLEVRRVRGEARKDRAEIGCAHMPRGDFGEHVAEVRRQLQVAAFIQLFARQSRPLAIDFAALDRAAERERDAGVAMIGAARTVLPYRPPELGHRDDHYIAHAVAKIVVERG